MATLVVQDGTQAGIDLVFDAADAGLADEFANSGSEIAVINNGGGAPVTLTVDDTGSVPPAGAETFDADMALTVAAGGVGVLGPFPTGRFTSLASMAWDQVATVTVAIVRVS